MVFSRIQIESGFSTHIGDGFKPEEVKLDILHYQAPPQPNTHIDFSQIKKPTELEPLVDTPAPSKVAPAGSVVAPTAVPPETVKFIAPKSLNIYINNLIVRGRKLRGLAFDIGFARSNDEIKGMIAKEFDKGSLDAEEKNEMGTFLVG